jgi:selenoprotein W-related protein
LPKAVSLTEELVNNFKTQIERITVIPSGGGIFNVDVNGERIFSRKEVDRFPQEGEISTILEKKYQLQRIEE